MAVAAVLGSPCRSSEINGLASSEDSASLTARSASQAAPDPDAIPEPPLELRLKSDRQSYDARRQLFIAEGNVRLLLNGGVLQADRLEFDSDFNSLFARGSVRYRKGAQYFQASTLRFSLVHRNGAMEDVYGVLDLDSAAADFNPFPSNPSAGDTSRRDSVDRRSQDPARDPKALLPVIESTGLGFPTSIDIELESSTANRISPQGDGANFWEAELPMPATEWAVPDKPADNPTPGDSMACPAVLPPIPDWHPHPWAVTAWGGQMIDSNFGDTFLFNGRMRPEYLLGVSLQKRIWRAGPLQLELEADLFGHQAYMQQGGPFNQDVPNADTPGQLFGEGILGIGARLWVQPWLSFGFVEGISYNTSVSNYEKTYRENFSQLLNYLGFELEATVSEQLSLVGRIHHRSGAFGTYNGVKEGSNAYLVGVRYRWGQDQPASVGTEVPPPLGCPDPDRESRLAPQTLSEKLEDITLGNPTRSSDRATTDGLSSEPLAQTRESRLSPREQERLRSEAIAALDQRITSIQLQQRFVIEQNQGVLTASATARCCHKIAMAV